MNKNNLEKVALFRFKVICSLLDLASSDSLRKAIKELSKQIFIKQDGKEGIISEKQ